MLPRSVPSPAAFENNTSLFGTVGSSMWHMSSRVQGLRCSVACGILFPQTRFKTISPDRKANS